MVKDTTKEDHYVEIAVGFKIIYNQNQYLAYTEVPKKKKDIRLEIYIGKLSILKDQYLLFKCENESEKRQVFSYFKQVFSGEINSEIEMADFSMIEKISIVSSDLFEEKMDQYPNFFILPKKEEEISASITLPSFFMKKTSKIKDEPEEIQFVENSDEVLESNVEATNLVQNMTSEQNLEPTSSPISTQKANTNQNVEQEQLVGLDTSSELLTEQATIENKPVENIVTSSLQETVPVNVDSTPVTSNAQAESTVEPTSFGVPDTENDQNTDQVPVIPNPEPILEMATSVNDSMDVVGVPPIEPILNPLAEEPVKFEQIYDGKKQKKNGKISIIILMVITLVLIASIVIVYVFVVEPKMNEQKPNNPPAKEPETPKTSKLVCTIETEKEDNNLESKTITFVYDNTSKNILSSTEHTTVTMQDADKYMEKKAMIEVFNQELKNIEGQKYTFKYDDKKYIYQVLIDRDYEKVAEAEKDDTWKSTFDEANEYYLEEGYTCNGVKKEPSNEKDLTSTTGNNTVDYNNWVVTYQKAVLSEDKETLSITLEVTNKVKETRILNGALKLFDKDNQNIRNMKLTQQIEANETNTIIVDLKSTNENKDPELGSLETINFENITQYLIELYR